MSTYLNNIIKRNYLNSSNLSNSSSTIILNEKKEEKKSSLSSPSSLSPQDITIILKWLATIEENHKIDISSLQIIPNNIINNFNRTLNNIIPFTSSESRHQTINFINYIISETKILLSNLYSQYTSNIEQIGYKSSYDKQKLKNLIKTISAFCVGISKLKLTYRDDTMFGCVIDTLIEENINIELLHIKEKNPELFEGEIKEEKENISSTERIEDDDI
jgi:hypothetical protein